MARIPTVEVTSEVLDCLFDELDIWTMIHTGQLTSKPCDAVPSYTWPNAMSVIIKHSKPNGKHIATTHCIKDDSGHVFHWDAKDLRLHDLRLWRA